MQQFYAIFDYTNYKFAINGAYTPTSEIKEFGFRDPEAVPTSQGNKVIFIVIAAIVIVLAVVAIIGCVIVRLKNRRLEENLAKYETL